jgi:hypothetical protein
VEFHEEGQTDRDSLECPSFDSTLAFFSVSVASSQLKSRRLVRPVKFFSQLLNTRKKSSISIAFCLCVTAAISDRHLQYAGSFVMRFQSFTTAQPADISERFGGYA